ncbi:MAG: DUF2341 domain-containing protein [Candidatus Heimdallarchaeota archaeon]|nr:MAG: DUF2341 domain-containing protein [Candidatus Heimdallarchaeota archaeon]
MPIQKQNFWTSNGTTIELLQGFGISQKNHTNTHNVQRLANSKLEKAQDTSSDIKFNIHSPYTVGGWIDTRWKYRKNITISSSSVNSYLTNFPLYIDLKDEDLKCDAQVDGTDIFFTDTSGNVLDHEVELYNRHYSSTQAQLIAWVKTNLSHISDTTVMMYYGNPTTVNQDNPTGVWNSSEYEFVLHMNQDPSISDIKDSTSNNYDFTIESTSSMTQDDLVDGNLGKGISFDGSNDYIYLDLSKGFNGPTDKMSFQFWIMFPNGGPSATTYLGAPGTTFYDPRLSFDDNFQFRIESDTSSESELDSTQTVFSADNWYSIVCSWDGGVAGLHQIYIDGSLDSTDSTPLIGTHIDWNTFAIGAQDDAANGVGGDNPHNEIEAVVTEFRLLNAIKTSDWILTEYLNQFNPSNFYSVSIEESSPISEDWAFPLFRYRKNITINSSEVSGTTLVNFPVLINISDPDLNNPSKVQVDGDDILFASEDEWVWTSELIQNGNFEGGNLNGWTSSGNWEVGTKPPLGSGGPQFGSYCAYVSSGGASSDYIRQDVSISGYSSYIDNGKAIINASAWLVSSEPDYDNSNVRIQFLDSSKDVISTPLDTGYLQTPNTWTQYSISNMLIPTNTRYIRVWARCLESGWDAGSVDSFSLKIATLQKSNVGIKLNHEIESFDQTGNGTHAHLRAWVKVPALRSGIDSNITLYYGNNAVRTQENPSTTWNDYEGVWHFEEVSGTGSYIRDSTKNDHDGTPYSTNYIEMGKIGGMREFTGDTGSRIDTSNSDNIFDNSTTFSFSLWIYPNYTSDLEWEQQSGGRVFYAYSMRLTRLWRQSFMSSGTGRFQPDIKWSDSTTSYSNVQIYRQSWNLIHYSYDGEYLRTYVNGNPMGSAYKPNGSLVVVSEPFVIGDAYSSQSFKGYLDEFRVAHTFRSADWILTEFNNQNNPDNFITVKNEEEYSRWWVDASFTKRRDIVIYKENVFDNLFDFPVLIEIDDASLKSGNIQADAADLLFTTANGTKLDHEIEYFSQNVVQGHLIAWVRLPFVSGSEDTCISMYYGNSNLLDQQNPFEVWDSNYKGVWHLKEDPSSSQIEDSTYNANHASSSGGMTSGDQVTGKINGALDFDGSDDYLSLGDLGTNGQTALTLSTWIYPTGTIHKAGLLSEVGNRDNGLAIETDWQCLHIRLNFGPGYNVSAVSTNYPPLNEYTYVTAIYNHTHLILYLNGELATPRFGSNPQIRLQEQDAITISDWAIGRASGYFEGILDEPRVSIVARSLEWIKTEYQNQYDPVNFYSAGSEVVFDTEPPVVNDFGVEDLGTGIGEFWADISDSTSEVASAEIKINGNDYSMTFNGSYWIYQLQATYHENYVYQITNASDAFGNFLQFNTTERNYNFTNDIVAPNVLARYFDHKFTFTANVTDSWGTVDTVIVNVTYHSETMPSPSQWVMTNYQNFSNIMGYIRDDASISNGDIKYQIFVNDTAGNFGVSSITESYVYVNHPPVAGNLTLSPLNCYSNSTLVLAYDYYDDETPDYESGTEICWYRNNGSGYQLHSTYHYPVDGTVALERDHSELFPDDEWYVTVTPKDGELFGDRVNSSSITVLNTPPSLSNVELKPVDPVTTNVLSIEYTYSDYDQDNETIVARQIEWYKVGSGHIMGVDNQTSITPDQTSKGDEFYVRMRVNDGTSYSNWVNSSHVIIKNSPPEAVNLTISPVDARTNDSLVASWDMADVDTGDTENKAAAIIYWYKNGQIQSSWTNLTLIGSGNTTKNEWWHFKVQVFDGENYSDLIESPHIQILNTPPIASNVAITINPLTTDDLTASWSFNDTDVGDTQPADSWIIRWYKDNQLQTVYNNEKIVPASATSKGDVWNFTLKVSDGTNYSILYSSPTTVILNSPPTATDLMIPSNPTTEDNLIASWTALDVDGDNPNDYLYVTIIKWYNWTVGVGDWVELISAQNSTFLGWGNTSKGEVWRYTVRIFDGSNYSITEYISANTTIINSIPTVISPTFNKTTDVTTVDTINITYTYNDADDDHENTIQRIVYWFTNGVYNASKFNNVTLHSSETKSTDFWQYKIRVYDGTSWSQNYTSSLVVIGSAPNNIPEVQNLNLTANTNTTTEDLIFDYDYIDVDGHLQSDREIRWYKGGLLQPALNDSLVVDASLTTKDDIWNCTIRVFDGLNWSILYNSIPVTILNSVPIVSDLSITNNPTTTTDLVANWAGSDNDGEGLTYNITWFLNGEFNSSWETTSTSAILTAGNTTKNDKWYFSINATDGESFSSIISLLSNVTIRNTAPLLGNLSITSNPTTTNDLVAGWDDSDIDNDPLTPLIEWFMNDPGQPLVGLSNKTTVESGNTSKNEVWWFKIRVYDGENYSTIYESMHVQIENTAPLNITDLPLPTEPAKANGIILNLNDILNALEDPDGDNIELTEIRWYKGSDLQTDLNDSLSVPGSRITKGEFWYYTILPSDGLDYGEIYTSENFQILNSKPIISLASFVETEARTIHNLTVYYTAEDADLDSISVAGVTWYWYDTSIPDWVPNGTYANMLILPNTATRKGDRWYFDIQVTDGTALSDWESSALQINILNSKPWIDPYSIKITGGTTTSDPLNLTYSWNDDDPEDSEFTPSITWETAVKQISNDLTNLSYINTVAGERWWVSIKPHDGDEYGELIISKYYGISIIIGNTPPVVVSVETAIDGLFNGTTYYGGSFGTNFDLVLRYNASDIDGTQGIVAYDIVVIDGYVVGSKYQWYRNRSGVTTLISALNDKTVVTYMNTKEGDIWWASIQPRDFYGDYGVSVNSTKITIGNTAPLILNLQWTKSTYFTTNSLSFQYTFYDYDTDDVEAAPLIYWYRNGTPLPQYINYQIIPSQVTNKSETWYVNISVWDGEAYSIWYQLPTITIQNTPPSTSDVVLLPLSPYTTSDLVATWNFTDPDGDLQNVQAAMIEWYRNGEYVGSFTSVPASMTNRGERWFFTINVTDGYDYSTRYQSNTITIINSAPTVMNILVNNGSQIYTTDTLEVTWEFEDIDSIDGQNSWSIIWYLDGEIQTQFNNQSLIPVSYVTKEQGWQVAIAVKDTGGLWSETVFSSVVFILNTRPTVTIHTSIHPEYIVEDEVIQITSLYLYSDADGDEPRLTIRWYLNGVYNPSYDNQTIITANSLQPGDFWNYVIWPHDGVEFGVNKTSPVIYIESRPQIHDFSAIPLSDAEGLFDLEVNVTDSLNNRITQVEYLLYINSTDEELASFIQTSPLTDLTSIWVYPFELSNYSYLDTFVLVNVTVVTQVNYSRIYYIRSTYTFTFTLEDKAPPRIITAYFIKDDEINPTNLIFFAEVVDYGSGIKEVILYYYFKPANDSNGGVGAEFLQIEPNWLEAQMIYQDSNSDVSNYTVVVPFFHNNSNTDIIYRIYTEDVDGNSHFAYDVRDFPEIIRNQRFNYQPPGLPEWVLLLAGLVIFVIFIGSIVYVKFIRKPELVGLDKDLVLKNLSDVPDVQVMASLDAHTIGVIVSFFDQRHGPIPIIVIPEILKDNFSKLVDLSDRSFSGTGFSDDFVSEIPSSYDFVLAQGLRTSVMSFGYSLERPEARGGQENLTCNILVHKDLFPLVNQFQDEIQREVHALHLLMDKDPSNKNEIRRRVSELRKYVSAIIISYEDIYGTTELLTQESGE